MRLDHLLSREKAEGETRKLIPRSMRASESGSEETRSKLVKGAARAAKHGNASAKTGESVAQDAQRHEKLLKIGKFQSVSFSGLGSSNGIETDRREREIERGTETGGLHLDNCTARKIQGKGQLQNGVNGTLT